MGVMNLFYDREVEVIVAQDSSPNELGVVSTIYDTITYCDAVRSQLNASQIKDRYGLDMNFSIEYTIPYNRDVYLMLVTNQVLFIVDDGIMYKVESGIVYDEFYVLDATINLICTKSDAMGFFSLGDE